MKTGPAIALSMGIMFVVAFVAAAIFGFDSIAFPFVLAVATMAVIFMIVTPAVNRDKNARAATPVE